MHIFQISLAVHFHYKSRKMNSKSCVFQRLQVTPTNYTGFQEIQLFMNESDLAMETSITFDS